MASLAQDLQNRGIRLEDPYKDHQDILTAIEKEQQEGQPSNDKKYPTPTTNKNGEDSSEDDEDYSVGEEETEDHDLEEYFVSESEEEEEELQVEEMSKRITKMSPKRKARAANADSLALQMASLTVNNSIQAMSGELSCPLLSGRWEVFDFNTDTNKAYVLMRMMIINGLRDQDDFQLSFVDRRTFKIRMKWPKLMQRCMMMTTLDISIDADGNPFEAFPAGHQVYTDMGKTAKKLKDEGGCIWSEGLFQFRNDMEMTMFEPQIFQIPENDGGGTILQIRFTEAAEEDTTIMPFGSPIVVKQAGEMTSKLLERKRHHFSVSDQVSTSSSMARKAEADAQALAAKAEIARAEAVRIETARADERQRAAEAEAARAITEAENFRAATELALANAAAMNDDDDAGDSEIEPSPKRNKTTHLAPSIPQTNTRVPLGKNFFAKAKELMNKNRSQQYDDPDPDL